MFIKAGELNKVHTGSLYSFEYMFDQGKAGIKRIRSGLLKMDKIRQEDDGTYITAFGVERKYDPEEILFIKTDWVHDPHFKSLEDENE